MDTESQSLPERAFLICDRFVIELTIRKDVAAAVGRQIDASVDFHCFALDEQITELLAQRLDRRFAIPSEAQTRFANVIARALQIELPEVVTLSKAACHEFISTHMPIFHETGGGRHGPYKNRTKLD